MNQYFSVTLLVLMSVACEDESANNEESFAWGEVTMINGEVPPGELSPLRDVTTSLDTIDTDGNRLVITRGVREAGTRVGIHVHKYGGHTCVLSGVITDFIEGMEPKEFPAGTCYYMPPNTIMSAANLGDEPAILLDTFILPPGESMITILEPGWGDVSN